MPDTALIREGGRWLRFSAPTRVVTARRPDEVIPALRAIETAVERRRQYAVGFIVYEAAAAYGLAVHAPPPGLPLLWFGFYESVEATEAWLPEFAHSSPSASHSVGPWRPAIGRAAYAAVAGRVKDYLARGHSYQVNYTFPLRAAFDGEPLSFFADLVAAQATEYAAFIDAGRFAVCSISPELFFRLDGERLTAKPMKGTAARGRTLAEDETRISALRQSEKNRAENLMIVDMLRNDLGRVARVGSVTVPRLFEVERYPTLLQMTSTVTAQTGASVAEILASLFPCASISGAPKVRSMEIIRELEPQPRGVYTGAIGFIGPGRQARFNVAIRTALIDRERRRATYGVGGGLVWDSDPGDEYEECLLKARVLTERRSPFRLLESLLWEPDAGYFLLKAHLARLADTAVYFGVPLDRAAIEVCLIERASALSAASKVRLLVGLDGAFALEAAPLAREGPPPIRVGLARTPVDSGAIWLYHKTTRRELYDAARASRPDCDEAILWNERGELTEASAANLALDMDGEWVTPPITSGLLAGTFRGWLLAAGQIRERVLTLADLRAARRIALINSVRKWRAASLVP
ncbi:MAG: aminodeoxychorismate synthase component I [Candidatus Contendobacter sp.]|nr:aminodeoxychorismate synthase component I [Candidatus Contendobacter sp.]MDG4556656.1 aminodeoxychorismate synthase component I [Candidatus Contendobacter sp.]